MPAKFPAKRVADLSLKSLQRNIFQTKCDWLLVIGPPCLAKKVDIAALVKPNYSLY